MKRKQVKRASPKRSDGSQAATGEPSVKKRGRPATGKRSDPEYEPTTLYMRIATKRAARIALAVEARNRELSDLVEELVSDWVKNSKM